MGSRHISKYAKGFTLIELMIVIAIIGILAAIAMPQYQTYSKRSKFSEVVLATTEFRTPAEIAVQTGGMTPGQENLLDAGSLGIPPTVASGTAVGQYVDTVTIQNGRIIGKGTAQVDSATYTLVGTITKGGIQWVEDNSGVGSCSRLGVC